MITTPDEDSDGARRARKHHRRPVSTTITGAAALVVAVAVITGAAAQTADSAQASTVSTRSGAASYLTTNPATVAGSVNAAVVDIVSTQKYQRAVAAGTGMILTSTGEILTNNHVIAGATSIRVTVASTGRRYTATVAGTDPAQDVAVLQLKHASGLHTIRIGDSAAVRIGQTVRASGNAGGTGGSPSTVSGSVLALGQTITASDDGGSAEQLSGLIETSAPIVPGDSGGPLASSGAVIGMDTAAAVSNQQMAYDGESSAAAASQGYAIPIATALTIAHQIETGQASSTIHLGLHGFLGVELGGQVTFAGQGFAAPFGPGSSTDAVPGATVTGLLDGGSAQRAGLSAGDVITSVDGRAVDGAATLSTLMATTRSGQRITLGWIDAFGQQHTSAVSLEPAPAD